MDTGTFVDLMQKCGLLGDKRLDRTVRELAPTAPDARTLARQLIQRDLLTPFQANQLLMGKSQSLILGQYRLMERLGQGTMGQIFKAVHVAMGRLVTIKLIAPHVAADPEVRARFTREVHNLAQLTHPNILAAFDAFESDGLFVLVMEFVEGTDLARLVRSAGPLPVPLACNIVRQAAQALLHVHEKGLGCCHIRPVSILIAGYQDKSPTASRGPVSSTVPRGAVKVVDLGLSLFEEATITDSKETVLNPLAFLAPEETTKEPTADVRSDVYRLGTILYFALTGKVPFPDPSRQTALETFRPDLPPALVTVAGRMRQQDPAGRYQTLAEVVAELAAFCPPAPAGARAP
jgi:serine/threonine protein kinase